MNIVLATNSDNPRLEFRNCEKFEGDSGFRVDVFVRSGDITLETEFYFERFPLNEFIINLSKMATSLNGSAILKPLWEDDFIKFEMLELGHLAVTGKFSQHSPYEQQLKFGFETDQTAVRPLCEALNALLLG